MPWGDGIPKINCFSLTDFHEYQMCPFRFFVKHHLDRKYELEKGSDFQALGNILDLSIKIFHRAKAYGQPAQYLENLVRRAVFEIRDKVSKETAKPSFYSASAPFINEVLIKSIKEQHENTELYLFLSQKLKGGGSVEVKKIEVQAMDGLFEKTENATRESIRSNYMLLPVLLGDLVAGKLGTAQEIKDAYTFTNSIVIDDQMIMTEVFTELFQYWHKENERPTDLTVEVLTYGNVQPSN